MLTGEYRFITPRTGGNLKFDYLPDDRKTDDARYHYRFEHNARLTRRWGTRVVVNRVSDDQYFQDFSNSLAAAIKTVSTQQRRYNRKWPLLDFFRQLPMFSRSLTRR